MCNELNRTLDKYQYNVEENDSHSLERCQAMYFLEAPPGSVSRRQKDGTLKMIPCPPLVPAYNSFMGGVDLSDLYCSSYRYDRKSKRWWLRIFYAFLDFTVDNAYILYNKHACNREKVRAIKSKMWRVQLVKGADFTAGKVALVFLPDTKMAKAPDLDSHKVSNLRQGGIVIGECMHCSKPGKRKRTVYGCSVVKFTSHGLLNTMPKFCSYQAVPMRT